MGRPVHPNIITPDSALGGKDITRSLRFNGADTTAHLTRAPSTSGNRKVWTFSAWIKIAHTDDGPNYIYAANNSNTSYVALYFRYKKLYTYFHPTNNYGEVSSRLFSDVGSWIHVVHQVDAGDFGQKIWINGEALSLNSGRNPANNDYGWNQSGVTHRVGNASWRNDNVDGYLADVYHTDGQLKFPSDFGYTESQTGMWRPKKYEGTYGTNGFHLDFSDNSAATAATLGKDRSGNGNDFTPNSLSVSAGEGNDSFEDTPTDNFVTLNPLERFTHNCTLSNGNLKATGPNESYPASAANIALSSGKWYYEFVINTKTSNPMCGVCKNDYVSGGAGRILYRSTGHYVMHDGSEPSDPDSFAVGDIIGVAIDLDDTAGNIRFYKNGTLQTVNSNLNSLKSQLSISTLGGLHPYIQMYHNDVCTVNFGQRPFSYTPPTGFKALSSNNLPPTVPSIIAKKHFDTVLYTGNGSTGQSITSLEFQPDLVWCKSRSNGRNHVMTDSVRGRAKGMYPDATNTDFTDAAGRGLVSFNSNGFTVGNPENASSHNNSGETIVAWCWKAGGNSNTFNVDGTGYATAAAAGLDGGSLDPTGASINTEAGFSIITYTGTNNTSETISHGLGKKPAWILVKSRSVAGQDWVIYHKKLDGGNQPATHIIKLNTSDAEADVNDVWNDTEPTSSVFTVGTEAMVNHTAGDTYLAYCWSEIPGYSKFGLYTGNGTSDGPFVYTGFTPRFIIYRKSPSENWHMFDTKRSPNNTTATVIDPNRSAAETTDTNTQIDILSNGFKLRSSHGTSNASSTDYIYMAWAEHTGATPYQTEPNAR